MLVVVSCVGFGGWIYPTPNVVRDGGTEMLSVMDMLAGSGKLLERTRREGRGNG